METGTSRKKQFLGMHVPGITSELQQQRWTAAQLFQRGLWLIGEKQSSYSCQILRMNANKSEGVIHPIGKLTQQIYHTH